MITLILRMVVKNKIMSPHLITLNPVKHSKTKMIVIIRHICSKVLCCDFLYMHSIEKGVRELL